MATEGLVRYVDAVNVIRTRAQFEVSPAAQSVRAQPGRQEAKVQKAKLGRLFTTEQYLFNSS